MALLVYERVPPRQFLNGLGATGPYGGGLTFTDTLPGSSALTEVAQQQLSQQALAAEAARIDSGESPVGGGNGGTPSRADSALAWIKANKVLVGVGAVVVLGGAYLLLKK